MQDGTNNWKRSAGNGLLALGFGALAWALGGVAGRHGFDFATVITAVVSSYILADKRDWLTTPEGQPGGRTGTYGAMALYTVLVVLYVVANDGRGALLMPALFLPVVLAVVCYKTRTGLAVSAAMASVYLLGASHAPHEVAAGQAVCAALCFPAVAAFVRLLVQRLEDQFRAMSEQASELSALLDMSQMMDASTDLDMTLNLVLLNVQRLSDCQVCAVYLTNAEGDTLDLRAASGPRDRMALAPALPVAEARCGYWSVDETAPTAGGGLAFYAADVSAVSQNLSRSRLFELDRRAGSFACVPLVNVEGLLGMLYVGYDAPQGLDAHGVQRLENLTTRAAFSLRRAVFQQGFRSLAFSDAMTGLDNFRQFEENLGAELRRAERYDRGLSVILLDIDHFKTFNDTLGHQAGDALLAQLATVLRDSLRSVDKPARYGGEEFVVLCPETGRDEARLIAERIRHNVEQTSFALLGGEDAASDGPAPGMTRVTVSVGYATFPNNATDARDLVKRADQALYAAKDAGRNAVRGYDEVPAMRVVAA